MLVRDSRVKGNTNLYYTLTQKSTQKFFLLFQSFVDLRPHLVAAFPGY